MSCCLLPKSWSRDWVLRVLLYAVSKAVSKPKVATVDGLCALRASWNRRVASTTDRAVSLYHGQLRFESLSEHFVLTRIRTTYLESAFTIAPTSG